MHAGVGLRSTHYRPILEGRPDVGFFEVHAENYMGEGGPPHRYLSAIRRDYPLSLHGVGLSIGSAGPLDASHLARLKGLIKRYQPALFSEHLAWSSHGGHYLDDLLPLPYTRETLARVCSHVSQAQATLGRRMLLENPATYVAFTQSTWGEADFIREIVRRTGCGLLLDINNAYVACTNQQWNVDRYLAGLPLQAVGEIHLAGHACRLDARSRPLLVDSHDRPVADAVWALLPAVLARTGPTPVLVEWDTRIPEWTVLRGEALKADRIMGQIETGACADGTSG